MDANIHVYTLQCSLITKATPGPGSPLIGSVPMLSYWTIVNAMNGDVIAVDWLDAASIHVVLRTHYQPTT